MSSIICDMNCDQETNKSIIEKHCSDCLCMGKLANGNHQLLEFGNSDVLPANLGVLHQCCHANYLLSYMLYYHILNYYLQNWVYLKNNFLGISSHCVMLSASKKLGGCTTIFCILHSYPHLDYTKTLRLDRKTLKFPDIYGVQICR